MKSLFVRLVAGFVPAVALAGGLFVAASFAGSSAQARERPQGDWYRYCKNADLRGDILEADCRKHGGGWRKNTRINFDRCPGNAVTVDDGRLVCMRGHGYGYGYGYKYPDHNGWGNGGWDRGRDYGWNWGYNNNWDRRDWDRRNWDRRDVDRRDWDRDRRDNDRYGRDGRSDGYRGKVVTREDQRSDQRRDGDGDWNKNRRSDENRKTDRRDDTRRRDNDRDEWWKRGNS